MRSMAQPHPSGSPINPGLEATRSRASHAQATGFSRFMSLVKTYSQSDDELDSASSSAVQTPGSESEAECQRRLKRKDEKIVDSEIEAYEKEGTTSIERQVDLLLYWEVSRDFAIIPGSSLTRCTL